MKGPFDRSNGMSDSGIPLSMTKAYCRCCREIRLDSVIIPSNILASQIYGFGGLAVAYQKPGTIMVAALNM